MSQDSLITKFYIKKLVTNTIKRIYFCARIVIDPLLSPINVNKTVLQEWVLSPIFFNLYINDLLIEWRAIAFEVLGYADDISVICETIKI